MNMTMNLMASSASGTQSVQSTAKQSSTVQSAKQSAASSDQSSDNKFSNVLDKAQAKDTNEKAPGKDLEQSEQAAKEPAAAGQAQETSKPANAAKAEEAVQEPSEDEPKPAAMQGMAVQMAGLFGLTLAAMQTAQTAQTPDASAAVPAEQGQGQTALNNLQSLLTSQEGSTAQAAQNQQLLDMLSAAGQTTVQTTSQAAIPANPLLQNAAQTAASGAGLTELSTAGLTDTAAQLIQNAQGTQNLQGKLNTQTTASDTRNDDTSGLRSLLAGVPLTVEGQSTNDASMQQSGSGFMQQPSAQTTTAESVLPGGMQQLPEEAQFDMAPLTQQTDSSAAASQQNAVNALQQTGQTLQTTAVDTGNVQNANASQAPDFDVPRQIVEQARLIRSAEDTQMVIKLKPEHLGELTLKVSVSADGAVNASFHSDNAQVRTIIENTMVQLRQDLQAQGLKVDNVSVYAGLSDNPFANGQQQSAADYQQQGGSARSQKIDLAAFEEDTDAVNAAVQANEIADGIDYRV